MQRVKQATGLENGNGQLNGNGLPVLNPFTSRSDLVHFPLTRTVCEFLRMFYMYICNVSGNTGVTIFNNWLTV